MPPGYLGKPWVNEGLTVICCYYIIEIDPMSELSSAEVALF